MFCPSHCSINMKISKCADFVKICILFLKKIHSFESSKNIVTILRFFLSCIINYNFVLYVMYINPFTCDKILLKFEFLKHTKFRSK